MDSIKVVCIGDSLTMAHGVPIHKGWVSLANQALPFSIINKGLSGDTTAGMLARLHEYVNVENPSAVIIMGGTNDLSFNLPFNLIMANIHAMTRQLKYQDIQAIIGIPPPIYDIGFELRSSTFTTNPKLIESLKTYTNLLNDFVANDGFKSIDFQSEFKKEYMSQDGVHPNEIGHEFMAKKAIAVLKSLN